MKSNAKRVALVDDSAQDRLLLRTMLERLPDVVVTGEASDLRSARVLLEDPTIDAVFLDIELGRENSFSLLRGSGRRAHVVFTTVHRDFALASYEAEAVDYLVKPVREDRLVRALARLDALMGRTGGTRVTVERGGSDRQLLALDSVFTVIGDGKHTLVHAGKDAHPDRRSLREWEALLKSAGAERVDRSTLLRTSEILAVKPYGRGARVTFRNSPLVIELGRAGAARLSEIIGIK